ncbi:hypothetical protein B0H16DRAFT_1728283 [Mycena metata]|uniref:Uncharacterized protein n=1 Tax=Mycena metata TaxID=1033252 RepID=A0AAD7N1W5_9AGAR|nr:hypothetical protein B0H16DRAFT_1728283 [Mycena metata]
MSTPRTREEREERAARVERERERDEGDGRGEREAAVAFIPGSYHCACARWSRRERGKEGEGGMGMDAEVDGQAASAFAPRGTPYKGGVRVRLSYKARRSEQEGAREGAAGKAMGQGGSRRGGGSKARARGRTTRRRMRSLGANLFAAARAADGYPSRTPVIPRFSSGSARNARPASSWTCTFYVHLDFLQRQRRQCQPVFYRHHRLIRRLQDADYQAIRASSSIRVARADRTTHIRTNERRPVMGEVGTEVW